MQCILREKLLAQAKKLAGVSNVYRTESYRFVDAYFAWLEEAEKDLSSLRSPIGILLQSEKSSLTSVSDGYVPDQIHAGKSIRKIQRATAAQSLEKVSREIYSKIEDIDQTFNQQSEKLSNAIAVLAIKEPELYDRLQINQHGVDIIRKSLSKTPETIPIYNYLCAKLASSDINYLLLDIIHKIVSNKTDAHKKSTHSSKDICDDK